MPPILIPIITAAGVTGGITIGASTVTYASLIAYGITTLGTLGASFLLQGQQKQKGASQQVTVKQALPARTRSYGRVKVGGSLAFLETGDAGALYRLVVHSDGEWDAIEEWWLNDSNAELTDGNVTVLPWGSNITIESHLGAPTQAASPALLAAFGGVWTTDHRLRGLVYSVVRSGWIQEKFFGKVYPNGAPELRIVGRSSRVFDPRSGLTQFSRNSSLAILDHLKHSDGLRIAPLMIDESTFGAFANVCDGSVPLAAGGTEPRYSVDLTYSLTDQPIEVHRKLLQTCDAEIYPTSNGKIGIRGGLYDAPTVTLDEDCITSYKYSSGSDKLAAFNHLKITCTNPAADYQPVEIDPWEDVENQSVVGLLQQDLPLTQVSSWTQARRLGKIALHRGNPKHKLSIQTNAAGIIALGERCVRVHVEELDLDASFLIESCELRFEETQLVGCSLELSSIEPAAYAWTTAEEGQPPVTPQDTSHSTAPPTPTGLSLGLERTVVTGGVYSVKISATVTPPSSSNWQTIGRYRKVGDSEWLDMIGDGDWSVISDVVDDGEEYEVQAAHTGYGGSASGNVGEWTDSETITTVADETAPDLPSGLGRTTGAGTATVSWFNPTSANFYAARVYRNTSNNFGTSVVVGDSFGSPGQLTSRVESLSAGTYFWWVTSINRSGVESSPVGPVSGTVT